MNARFQTTFVPAIMRTLLLLSFLWAWMPDREARADVNLDYDWTIEVQGKHRRLAELGTLWKDLPGLPEGELEVVYRKTFPLAPADRARGLDLLVLPPHWARVTVVLNGRTLSQEGIESRAPARIFAHHVARVPREALAAQNTLVLRARTDKWLGGFRENRAVLTRAAAAHGTLAANDFLRNDIHIVFATLALVVGAVCTGLSLMRGVETWKYGLIALASFMILPHHLLASQLYPHVFDDPSSPFRFQLAAQVVVWPSYLAFFVLLTRFKDSALIGTLSRPGVQTGLGAFALLVVTAAFGASFHWLVLFVYPVLAVCAVGATLVLSMVRTQDWAFWLFLLGTSLNLTSLVSDAFSFNHYYLGYGISVFTVTGLAMLVMDFNRAFREQRLFSRIVRNSLPRSVHRRIEDLVRSEADMEAIRAQASGCTTLSIVLVDICDWGKMNDIEVSKIPSGIIAKARLQAFSEIERIMGAHGLDFIKTNGDNMEYCGGLFRTGDNREKDIAVSTLSAVRDVLGGIDAMNAGLRDAKLPVIKIKVSASMGMCDFGLEQFNDRLQFDIQGHAVNVAYRIESAMDEDFYQIHSKNVALVSNSIVNLCDDLVLRARFPDAFIVTDKHGFRYQCYVGTQHDRKIALEDFANAMFGLFGHKRRESARARRRQSGGRAGTGERPHAPDSTVPSRAGEADTDTADAPRGTLSSGAPSAHANALAPDTAETRESSGLHGSIPPAALPRRTGSAEDKRVMPRRKIFLSDKFEVKVTLPDGHVSGYATDLSNNGLALAISEDAADACPSLGQVVALTFKLNGQQLTRSGRVKSIRALRSAGVSYTRIGFALIEPERSSPERITPRFGIPDFYEPVVSCEDPMSARNLLHFRVIDLSASGLALITPTRTSGLLVGLELNLKVHFPMQGEGTFKCVVRNVCMQSSGSHLRVGVQIVEDLERFQAMSSRFLLACRGDEVSVSDLRNAGYAVQGIRSSLHYSYVESDAEFDQVCALRLKAWRHAGKFTDVTDVRTMADTFDQHARHIICKVAGRIVAAGRIVFNDGDPARFEHASYGVTLPDWLLAETFVEASRIVTDPEYRGDDLFLGLLQELGRVTVQTGHRYVLQSCAPSLFRIYARFGFKDIGTFTTDECETWTLALLDMEASLNGSDGSLLGWALIASELSKELIKEGVIQMSLVASARTALLDAVRPLALNLYKSKAGGKQIDARPSSQPAEASVLLTAAERDEAESERQKVD